ncbi:MAG: SIS domain-containing protein [Lawsonibacter sp.]|nr:SIS domain-containing protein [Lawsonibacter sp.]
MGNEKSRQAVEAFLTSAKEEFLAFANKLNGESYDAAVSLILESQNLGGRLHITGIGKPGHVAAYMASLFSSTGNPCYFLHGTEAVHGSCGQLMAGDVVIAISNSGETSELKATVLAIKNNGCKVIGVTGKLDSWLARESDACLYAGVGAEGGPLNRAPRNSILAEELTLQALSVALQAEREWSPQEYVRCHPGGKLGQLREAEK